MVVGNECVRCVSRGNGWETFNRRDEKIQSEYARTRSTSSSTDLSSRAAWAGAAGATTSATSVASSSRPERRALGLPAPLGTGAASSAWRTTRTGERTGACCCCSPASVVAVVRCCASCACLSATRQATQQRFARALLLPPVVARMEEAMEVSLPLTTAGSRQHARCAAAKAASWRPSSRRAVACCVFVRVYACVSVILFLHVLAAAKQTYAHAPWDCVHSTCSFPAASLGSRSASRASHSAVTCLHHCAFPLQPPSSFLSCSSSTPSVAGCGAEEAAAAAKSRGLDLWMLVKTDGCH